MSLFSSLRQLARCSFPQSRRPRPLQRPRFRPRLLWLEDRTLPSTVMNLADSGPGSLRDAIASTPAGGPGDFEPGLSGIITLTSGELAINKDLSIAGPGASVITVSGNHASRVFDIAAPETVAIAGLTIADGRSLSGGGILNAGTLTVTDSTLSGNSATFGGGFYNPRRGPPAVASSTLSST